jgi:hypothetical protein
VPEATILLDPHYATTDQDGYFTLQGSLDGQLLVLRQQGRELCILDSGDLARFRDAQTGVLTIPLRRGATVHGVYYDKHRIRDKIAVNLVMHRESFDLSYRGCVTDARDRYRYEGLPPGTYEAFNGYINESPRFRRRFTVKAGEMKQVDLGTDLGPYRLYGKIRDEQGKSVNGFRISATPEFEWEYTQIGIYDGYGEYSLPGLRNGPYSVSIKRQRPPYFESHKVMLEGDTKFNFIIKQK